MRLQGFMRFVALVHESRDGLRSPTLAFSDGFVHQRLAEGSTYPTKASGSYIVGSMKLPHCLPPVFFVVASVSAQSVPQDFEVLQVPGGYDRPVGLTFAPEGPMFVIEQRGTVLYHDGVTPQTAPFLDLADEVNHDHDRGMLGIVLHPGFLADGGATSWVYLLYTVSPVFGQDLSYDQDGKYSFSRLTRYRALTTGGDVVADPSSRQVLLGNQLVDGSVPDGIASLHNSHSNGSMHFADDGSLLLATGEGAHYDFNDTGGSDPEGFDDFTHPVTGLKGPTPAVQDSGSFRSQDPRSLAGKVLRIDPETGAGYASNPFYDGDVTSNSSRVWALGLRNPFRVLMYPGTGATDPTLGQPNVLAIGDVGASSREEMNLCQGGENFGWPCFEGSDPKFFFGIFDPPLPEFPNCNTEMFGTLTDPLVSWSHFSPSSYEPPGFYTDESGGPLTGFTGAAAIGGALYAGGPYPDIYDGRIFFSDFGGGWIKTIEVDGSYALTAIKPFAEGFGQVAAVESHPVTGDLHVVQVLAGSIQRVRYNEPDSVQPYGCGVNPVGSLTFTSPAVRVGETADFQVHNPLATQSPGSSTALGIAVAPDPAFPCGTLLSGFGMLGPTADGEILLSLLPGQLLAPILGPPWPGTPATISVNVPYLPAIVGQTVFLQGMIVDPSFGGGPGVGTGLTQGLSVLIGS